MNDLNDHALLQAYIDTGSDEAFRRLVDRHVDLVFAVARRTVRSSALAEEVTQAVFCDLARHARRVGSSPLVAWLHVVARRTAIDCVRSEQRRLARECEAAAISAMTDPEPPWSVIEPLLDDAVEALPPEDRHAVLLRFFQGRTLRDVGEALGVSEDAAQKRVTRAVDRLRETFVRRGVVVSGAALAAELSAHAIETMPSVTAGAVSTIALAAVSELGAAGVAHASRALAMTTLNKVLIGASVGVALGVGGYQVLALQREHAAMEALERQIAATDAERARITQALRRDRTRLATVEKQIDQRIAAVRANASDADSALRQQIDAWQAQIDLLKQVVQAQPKDNVPELALLGAEDWLSVAQTAKLETPDGMRRAMAALRSIAAQAVERRLAPGIRAYQVAHGFTMPSTVAEFAPLVDPPLDATILQRCAIVSGSGGRRLVFPSPPADPEYDMCQFVGPRSGSGSTGALRLAVTDAIAAFAGANEGRQPSAAEQLAPFLHWPIDAAVVDRYLAGMKPKSP